MVNYFEKLQDLFVEMKDAHDKLSKLQSFYDKQLSNYYHELERKDDFSVEEGNEFARQLKQSLDERRCIKDEISRLGPVYNALASEMKRIEQLHDRAARKSFEIRQTLNVTMDIDDVLATMLPEEQLA